MFSYKLRLNSDYGNTIEFQMQEKPNVIGIEHYSKLPDVWVCSDHPYHAKLICDTLPTEYNLRFYINGDEVEVVCNDNNLHFPEQRIFSATFGLVELSIEIITDSDVITLYSPLITVLVSNNTVNNSVQRMAEYVYYNHEDLLIQKNMKSRESLGLKDNAPKDIETKIHIISNIIQVYSQNHRYFSTNAKFHLQATGQVDDYEKLQKITPATLAYITQHPEQLTPIPHNSGIQRNQRNYLPHKTLIIHNTANYNTYENRIIVNFLKTVYLSIKEMIAEIEKRLTSVDLSQVLVDGYYISTIFIFALSKRKLKDYRIQLTNQLTKIESLYIAYRDKLSVASEIVSVMPRPTPIFTSIPQYRMVFNQIEAWFNFGIYRFEREDFILPMLRTDKLYECYVLLKLHHYFCDRGFEYQNSKKISYPDLKYPSDPVQNNTYHYYNDKMSADVTIYYEPAIYGKKHLGYNELGLYRNTSISFDGPSSSLPYYLPDYVIKIKNKSQTRYVILDAKFSTFRTVRNRYFPKLVYKYLFSLAPINTHDCLAGLCVINGKSNFERDRIYNAYDLSLQPEDISPFAKIMTLTENTPKDEEHHSKMLDSVFDRILFESE